MNYGNPGENQIKKNTENDNKKPISISSNIQSVFNNIERVRIEDEAYTKEKISLIFKKKDEMNIENYRPATLLEMDYKIHTKTVANKLGRVFQKKTKEALFQTEAC